VFAAKWLNIRIIYYSQPSGLANAFRQGFSLVDAHTDAVVTMDADLNHQPEEMPRLVNALFQRNADIVVGSRKVKGSNTAGSPLWKRLLSDTANRLLKKLSGMPVADMTSGYRVYRYDAFRQILFANTGFAFLPEILIRLHDAGYRIVEEPIQFVFRVAGKSKMQLVPTALSYIKLLSRWRNPFSAARVRGK
jgi:glycosyltransferase involved in cell wall biosynthesis